MKKFFIMALVCCNIATNAANAQTESIYYGSKKGGFAISVGAKPILNYVGNMFNGSTDNSLVGFGSVIMGKYFLTNRFALEAGVTFDNSNSIANLYNNGAGTAATGSFSLDNDWKVWTGGRYLLLPGKRLQPYIGAKVMYMRKCSIIDQEDYNNNVGSKTSYSTDVFILNACAGIEYFFKQNISINLDLNIQAGKALQESVSEYDIPNHYETENIQNNLTILTTYSEITFNFYF